MPKKQQPDVVHVGSIMSKLLDTCRAESADLLGKISQHWCGWVDPVVAENTRPAAIKGKVLLVHVSSSAWLHQMMFLNNVILDMLAKNLGENMISEIKFKIGPLAP